MSLVLLFHYLLLNMFRMLLHSSSGACDLLWIYFMGCVALVRCVFVLRCGSAGVMWYPYAGWSKALFFAQHVSNASTFIFRSLRLCVGILLWFDVCWRYGVVWLGWCGILMQAEAKLYFLLNMFRMLVHSSSGACDCVWVYCSGLMCVGVAVWFSWGDVVSLCRVRHIVP